MKIAWIIGISLVCSALYRLGGLGGFKGAKLLRRTGCSFCFFWALWALQGLNWAYWWAYALCFGLTAGAMSTYNDWLAPDHSSENWLCWLVTGLFYGLAALPLIWTGITWYSILLRSLLLAGSITWLRERTGNVWKEELGTGFLFIASIPLLLL